MYVASYKDVVMELNSKIVSDNGFCLCCLNITIDQSLDLIHVSPAIFVPTNHLLATPIRHWNVVLHSVK